MSFKNIIYVINNFGSKLLQGVGNTLLISLVSTIIGLLIGLIIGVIRTMPTSRNAFVRFLQKAVDFILSCYIEVFRGTPMMVQAMVFYWGYAFATDGRTLPLIPSALFIVSINTGAYMAEIVRGGIISIDKGQFEGAQAIGMNHFQIMIHVVIPQVMRNILPSVSNEFVINIKDTSVLNVIGVTELFYKAKDVAANSYKALETYIVVSAIYLIMTFTITRLLRLVEKWIEGKEHYQLNVENSDDTQNTAVSANA